MTMESWLFGDPERVLERKQEIAIRNERACGGCIHARSEEFKGEVVKFCRFKRWVYGDGNRCGMREAKKS